MLAQWLAGVIRFRLYPCFSRGGWEVAVASRYDVNEKTKKRWLHVLVMTACFRRERMTLHMTVRFLGEKNISEHSGCTQIKSRATVDDIFCE